MKFELVPTHELPLDEQARIFNRAFAGYIVKWTEMDANGVAQFIRPQGVDLCYSRFMSAKGVLAGFGYINRTGNISRLAAMGVVPEARRSGASTFLLSRLIDEAKSRSDEAMVLEVFEQNVTALALYRRHNFRELMRLFGWRRPPAAIDLQIDGSVEEISLFTATQIRSEVDYPDIPWQVSRHVVPKFPEAYAYRAGNICAVISDPLVSPIRIFALFGCDTDDTNGARDLLVALFNKFPRNEFFVREVFPQTFADLFQTLGFTREPLNQFLMRLDL